MGALGALLGALGALLGRSWALLGAPGTLLGRSLTLLGDLGSILEPSRVDFEASGGRFWSLLASISSGRSDDVNADNSGDNSDTTQDRRERLATTMQQHPEWGVHYALLESSIIEYIYIYRLKTNKYIYMYMYI